MTNVKFNRVNCRPRVSGMNFGKSPLNSLIDDFINGDFFGPDFKKTTKSVINNLSGYPAINIKEVEDAFHIELVAPGFEKDAFEIAIEADQLIIKAEMVKETVAETSEKAVTEEEEETAVTDAKVSEPKVKFLRREFTANHFNRSFTLPENVDTDAISANYEQGILTVALPKKEVEVKKVRTVTVA